MDSLVFKIFVGAGLLLLGVFLFHSKHTPELAQTARPQRAEAPKALPSPSPFFKKAPTGTEANENPPPGPQILSLSEFKEWTQNTLERLPTLTDLRRLKAREVHHMPAILQEAGQNLGAIAQALHDNPNLAAEAASFYKICFGREDLPVQVRGLCLANHRNLRITHGDRAEWTPEELQTPAEVQRLASLIPQ